jgi:hypothetical protein
MISFTLLPLGIIGSYREYSHDVSDFTCVLRQEILVFEVNLARPAQLLRFEQSVSCLLEFTAIVKEYCKQCEPIAEIGIPVFAMDRRFLAFVVRHEVQLTNQFDFILAMLDCSSQVSECLTNERSAFLQKDRSFLTNIVLKSLGHLFRVFTRSRYAWALVEPEQKAIIKLIQSQSRRNRSVFRGWQITFHLLALAPWVRRAISLIQTTTGHTLPILFERVLFPFGVFSQSLGDLCLLRPTLSRVIPSGRVRHTRAHTRYAF